MKKPTLSFLLLLISLAYGARSQQYIYISEDGIRQFLRVNAGLTQWSLTLKDSSAKTAVGLHLSNEVKIVSGFWKKDWGVTVHDAFYFDINLGRMNNEPRSDLSGEDKETRFGVITNMGYLALAGYRTNKWAVLGGVDFRWRMSRVGGIASPNTYGNLFNYSRPFVVRGEYCLSKETADKRAILMLWRDGGSVSRTSYFSTRAEYPLGEGGRWWLCFQYTYEKALSEDTFISSTPRQGIFTQFMLGVRIQNALL